MTFKVGDRVEWKSQAAGIERTKVGVVIEVVPPHADPQTKLREMGWSRDHESYVIRATALGRKSNTRTALYWPRASALQAAGPSEPARDPNGRDR